MKNRNEKFRSIVNEFEKLNRKSHAVTLVKKKHAFRFNSGDYALLKVLLPSASYKLNNYKYLAIRLTPSHLMVAHILVAVRQRLEGNTASKAFSVEYINNNPSDLRFKNIKVLTSKDKNLSKKQTKKSVLAHRAVSIIFKELLDEECPSVATKLRNGE